MRISSEASRLFPRLGAASFPVSRLRSAGGLERGVARAMETAAASMEGVADYHDVAAMAEVQAWRETMRAMGLRPGEYRSSLEALLRMWSAGRRPVSRIAAIDLYNCVSIAARAPLGAIDRARVPAGGELILRAARPGEDDFQPVAGSVTMKPGAEAVSYCLDSQVVCYALNHRDSALFGIGAETDDAVFFTEWTEAAQRMRGLDALERLAAAFDDAGADAGALVCVGWNGD